MLHIRSGLNFPQHKVWVFSVVVFVSFGIATVSAYPSPPQAAAPSPQVTFNRDIAPIIFHSCSSCHRPGEAAPFSLLTYSDVKKHARQIADVTQSHSMPPWLPDSQQLRFVDETRLADAEIQRIADWVEQGAV